MTIGRSDRLSSVASVAVIMLGAGLAAAIGVVGQSVSTVNPPPDPKSYVIEPTGERGDLFSWAAYQQYRDHARVPTAVAADGGRLSGVAMGPGQREPVVTVVSRRYFGVLGVPIAVGRDFEPDDEARGAELVAVLSRRFAAEVAPASGIVGKRLLLNGLPVLVIGVVSSDFRGAQVGPATDVWMPLGARAALEKWPYDRLFPMTAMPRTPLLKWLRVLVRANDATRAQAEAEARLVLGNCLLRRASEAVFPIRSRQAMRRLLLAVLLLGAVAIGGCLANFGTIQLARTERRRRDIYIRAVLGATRARIVRSLVLECVALAAIGGSLAPLASTVTLKALRTVSLPGGVPAGALPLTLGWDGVLDVLLGAMSGAAIVGLFVAWTASATATRSLRDRIAVRSPGYFHVKSVGVQTGFSVVLLTCFVTIAGTVVGAYREDLGFESRRVAFFSIQIGKMTDKLARASVSDETLMFLQDHREVESSTLGRTIFGPGVGTTGFGLVRDGQDVPSDAYLVRYVGPRFFSTLSARLVEGRDISETDALGAPCVAIVSRSVAQVLRVSEHPLGVRFGVPGVCPSLEIVGVAADLVREGVFASPRLTIYVPLSQHPREGPSLDFVIRSRRNPRLLVREIERFSAGISPGARVTGFHTADESIRRELSVQSAAAVGTAPFALVSVILSTLGVFALVAHSIESRKSELGVRLALGSSHARALCAAAGGTVRSAMLGCGAGSAAALGVSRVLATYLPGVRSLDVAAVAVACGLVAGAALAAAWLAGRRLSRVDPAELLRTM